jgi:hypothetical protein
MSISTDVYNLSLTLILSVAIVSAIAVYFTLLRGQLKNMTMRLDETIRLLKQLALTDIPGTNSEPFRDDPTNNLSPVPNPRTMTYGIPPATHASQGQKVWQEKRNIKKKSKEKQGKN